MSSTPPIPIPSVAAGRSIAFDTNLPNSYHGDTATSKQHNGNHHQRSSSTDSTNPTSTTTTTSATTSATTSSNTTISTTTTTTKDKEKQEIENLIKLYSNGNQKIESWTAISHLFKHLMTPGIVDFLCNKLYTLEDQDIDFFITQLWYCIKKLLIKSNLFLISNTFFFFYIFSVMLTNEPNDQKTILSSLAKFVMDRCAKSMRFAIKSYWIFQAFEEDGHRNIVNIETNAQYHQQQQQQHAQYQQHQRQQITSSSPSTSPNATSNNNGHSNHLRRVLSDDHLERDHQLNNNQNNQNNNNTTESTVNNNNNNQNNNNSNIVTSSSFPSTKIFINGEMFSPMMDPNNNNNNNNNHTSTITSFIRTPSTFELIEAKKELATRLREYCEMSVITCSRPLITRPRTSSLPSPHILGYSLPNLPPPTTTSPAPSPPPPAPPISLPSPLLVEQTTLTTITLEEKEQHTEQMEQPEILISTSNVCQSISVNLSQQETAIQTSKTPPIESSQPDYDFEFEISKSYRCDYLNSILSFVQTLGNISKKLISVPIDLRQAKLKDEISILNIKLPLGLYLPLGQESRHHCIVRIPPEEVKILNSRERVPFLLVLEMIEGDEEASAANILNIVSSYLPFTVNNSSIVNSNNRNHLKLDLIKKHIRNNSNQLNLNQDRDKEKEKEKSPTKITESTTTPTATTPTTTTATTTPTSSASSSSTSSSTSYSHFNYPFGELWQDKMERYRKISPYGDFPSWKMVSVIIKTGDDCRQEQMAVQLIRKFQEIWVEAKLPLYLRPYDILVTSSQSGIIETIPDTVSLHNLKKNTPNYTTLLAYFKSQYGEPQTEAFRAAQAKFVESLAAYSIVTYLLQVKDRHNGNILLDKEGHIIHIDFGFILSNSPGNMSFESAPFKLIQDWVDVIGGSAQSPMFLYFQALCVRGFLEARKHFDKFVSFIDLMMTGPRMSCFQGGRDVIIDQLKQRFFLDMTERECGNHVEQLISYSLDHRATRYYDYYQYYYNNIYA
ncbi:phosphatidylinositol 4-kinase [Cavenderia fasciculata]|uniref:1-phosphatidylinositol 4-kinase n=1 Tax=Cavenderia fasciculata TaxID=261658 RepID=F4Q6Y5_CACFS|nr:phosphatidylinositol 4-kinase [Cavenderia fasciculata]EGG16167.1 phosphatidylinositol 4-kinase [Cavenderia fasciculata]|eukprot:XP_004352620.1 phosphatidylinositol 4-kinase [Cavenderia fasciculata]